MKYLSGKSFIFHFLRHDMVSFGYSRLRVIAELRHGDLFQSANIVSRLVISFKETCY